MTHEPQRFTKDAVSNIIFYELSKKSSYIFTVFNEVYGILICTFHIITNFLINSGFLIILVPRKLYFLKIKFVGHFVKTPWNHINDSKIKIPANISMEHMYMF